MSSGHAAYLLADGRRKGIAKTVNEEFFQRKTSDFLDPRNKQTGGGGTSDGAVDFRGAHAKCVAQSLVVPRLVCFLEHEEFEENQNILGFQRLNLRHANILYSRITNVNLAYLACLAQAARRDRNCPLFMYFPASPRLRVGACPERSEWVSPRRSYWPGVAEKK